VARSAGGLRRVEQCLPPLRPVETQACLGAHFEAMSADPDFEYLIVDSTIVRAYQHAAGAKRGV
jgi:hypothetical protein